MKSIFNGIVTSKSKNRLELEEGVHIKGTNGDESNSVPGWRNTRGTGVVIALTLSILANPSWAQPTEDKQENTQHLIVEKAPTKVFCGLAQNAVPGPLSPVDSGYIHTDVAVLCPPTHPAPSAPVPKTPEVKPVCAPKISFDEHGAFLENGSLDGSESYWSETWHDPEDPTHPQYWTQSVYIVGVEGCDPSTRSALSLALKNQDQNTLLTSVRRKTFIAYRIRHEIQSKHPSTRKFHLELRSQDTVVETHVAHLSIQSVWDAAMFAGAGLSVYRPNGAEADHHTWTGVNLEYVLGTWKHTSGRSGPGFGKVLINTAILGTDARDDITITYGFGYRVSWERAPNREYLIPYYGLDFGGIYGPQGTKKHHSFQITPSAGMALYTNEHLSFSATGGYVLPLSASMEAQRGWSAQVGMHIYLW